MAATRPSKNHQSQLDVMKIKVRRLCKQSRRSRLHLRSPGKYSVSNCANQGTQTYTWYVCLAPIFRDCRVSWWRYTAESEREVRSSPLSCIFERFSGFHGTVNIFHTWRKRCLNISQNNFLCFKYFQCAAVQFQTHLLNCGRINALTPWSCAPWPLLRREKAVACARLLLQDGVGRAARRCPAPRAGAGAGAPTRERDRRLHRRPLPPSRAVAVAAVQPPCSAPFRADPPGTDSLPSFDRLTYRCVSFRVAKNSHFERAWLQNCPVFANHRSVDVLQRQGCPTLLPAGVHVLGSDVNLKHTLVALEQFDNFVQSKFIFAGGSHPNDQFVGKTFFVCFLVVVSSLFLFLFEMWNYFCGFFFLYCVPQLKCSIFLQAGFSLFGCAPVCVAPWTKWANTQEHSVSFQMHQMTISVSLVWSYVCVRKCSNT